MRPARSPAQRLATDNLREVTLCHEPLACENLPSESYAPSIERDIKFYSDSLRTFFVYDHDARSVILVALQYFLEDLKEKDIFLLDGLEESENEHEMKRMRKAEMLQTLLDKNDRYPFAVQHLDQGKIDEILDNLKESRLEYWIAYIETYHRIVRIRRALIAATAGSAAGSLALLMRRKFPFLTTILAASDAAIAVGGLTHIGAKIFGLDLYRKLIKWTFEKSSSLTRYRIFPKATKERVAELKEIVSRKQHNDDQNQQDLQDLINNSEKVD